MSRVACNCGAATPALHLPPHARHTPLAAISHPLAPLALPQLYCLVERKVKGDGNCQFRALSGERQHGGWQPAQQAVAVA